MQIRISLWVFISLFNLFIVALLGTLMRYKIGFEFPYFNQKFIQEAHSHFAFTGWISHTLFFLIIRILHTNLPGIRLRLYDSLIVGNLISAYGMLIAFFVQGYDTVSIFFSALSIVVFYIFAVIALRDIMRMPSTHPAKKWLWGAICFGIISTLGTIVLSIMMATRQYDQTTYLGSVYFYLHFQYNGWFLFGCIALLMDKYKNLPLNFKRLNTSFWMFFTAGLPTFFLSTLWADIPAWLYVVVILASLLQAAGWIYFLREFLKVRKEFIQSIPKVVALLMVIIASALSLKILLQLGSTHPEMSHLAFGFRPIVIAYLHLVLLLIVSIFLLTFLYADHRLSHTRAARIALIFFTVGAILNEVILAIQGISAFSYTVVPFVNEALFAVAMLMLVSVLLLLIFHRKRPSLPSH